MINILITFYSLVNGIDPNMAFQVARVESNMNPNAVSRTQDGGLYQLNRNSYKFHNEKWRFMPATNIAIAMDTLKKLRTSCKHTKHNSFVLCYNLGKAGASRIRYPLSQTYYKKMNILWQ
jgi:soluble lytic murein transglycosylase-like protein